MFGSRQWASIPSGAPPERRCVLLGCKNTKTSGMVKTIDVAGVLGSEFLRDYCIFADENREDTHSTGSWQAPVLPDEIGRNGAVGPCRANALAK